MSYSKQLAKQIQGLFELDIYNQGKVLLLEQRVTALRVAGAITASVYDRNEGDCKTFIQIHLQGECLTIDGECSCDQEFNCVHVVATLLKYIDSNGQLKASPKTQPPSLPEVDSVINQKSDKQLHYVLSLLSSGLACQVLVVSDKQTSPFKVPHSFTHPARFIQPGDIDLLQQIKQHGHLANGTDSMQSQFSQTLMDGLIGSGRCHWMDIANPVLQMGAEKTATWFWHQYLDGRQKLLLNVEQDQLDILPVFPLLYLDKKKHFCGPVFTGLTPLQNQQLFSMPAYHVQEIQAALEGPVLNRLRSQLPYPKCVDKYITKHQAPSVLVRINGGNRKLISGQHISAQISFVYPGGCINRFHSTDFVGEFSADSFIQWQRDYKQEAKLVHRWQRLGWEVRDAADQIDESWQLKHDLKGLSIARFFAFTSPLLVQQGWQIDCDNGCPELCFASNCDLICDLKQGIKHRQFGLKMMLSPRQTDSKQDKTCPINLLKALMLSLQSGWINSAACAHSGKSVVSEDGRVLIVIDNSDLSLILDCLIELTARQALDDEDYLLLSRARFEAVQTLLKSLTIELAEHAELRLEADTLHIPPSSIFPTAQYDEEKGLNAQLRPYQQQGVNWLHRLYQHKLGGLLADDMGLGKTLQILAFLWQSICRGLLQRPVLIVAPTSLLDNWKAEAEKFTPGLKLKVLHGPERSRHFVHLFKYNVVFTSYPLLIRDIAQLLETDWEMLILDEAQAIKNAGSKCAKSVREFNAGINICLSGTPLENHLTELWALFDFMLPGLLGSKSQFKDWFRTPIQEHNNTHRQAQLIQRISPVMLRRNKQTVLPQLPAKIHQSYVIELTHNQQQIYQGIELQMRQTIRDCIQQRGVDGSRIHILNALTQLRQICCDPRLLPGETNSCSQDSAKLICLLELLDEMLEQGRRVLIFSQFTSMLSLVEVELKKKNINYALLTGKTRHREKQVKSFQQGEVPLFLISLKAGGCGLNLTRADTVIHYDPWWNPAVENQATDRAHRIGQYASVLVYKLIAANTIEEKIVHLQQHKQLIADSLLEGASQQAETINSSDLNHLLKLPGV